MSKPRIIYPVIVEGKYDKIRLTSIFEAHVITTDGFGIFKKNEKAALLRALAQSSKLIVLTDSDGAGKVIRSHIKGLLPADKLIQLYIPQIEGKERRKSEASAEGTLGVEGMKNDVLYNILLPYADNAESRKNGGITKADFYTDGLTGKENSREKRDEIAKILALPSSMTPSALLEAINLLCTREKYLELVKREE